MDEPRLVRDTKRRNALVTHQSPITTNTMTLATPKNDLLLDPSFMARLDQLDVMSRKLLAGKLKGERRSKRAGRVSSSRIIGNTPSAMICGSSTGTFTRVSTSCF